MGKYEEQHLVFLQHLVLHDFFTTFNFAFYDFTGLFGTQITHIYYTNILYFNRSE